MDKAARLFCQAGRHHRELSLELRPFAIRQHDVLRLETKLAKVVELPFEELKIEAARECDAVGTRIPLGERLNPTQLVDRPPIKTGPRLIIRGRNARLEC